MPVVTVLPITSKKPGRKVYGNEVLIPAGEGGLESDSIILIHQIRTISKNRLKDFYGQIKSKQIKKAIKDAILFHLGLDEDF